jgi:glycosyltransferase involved in cell wall biosynthesis
MAVLFDIDIIVATLNSGKVLENCLKSIAIQNYPKNKIHLYISDGGSTDNTLKIAKKYHCNIVNNPLITAEAAKAIAFKNSSSEFVSFIDSDNILPSKNWLRQMLKPLEQNTKLIGAEPIAFTYRKNAGFIERYSALIGANDPYAFFTGVSDRKNYLNYRWTGIKNLVTKNYQNYVEIIFNNQSRLPTIGANGTLYRRNFINKLKIGNYLFDIDLISQFLKKHPQERVYFAKVKNSIIHTYCESSITKFISKQKRRVKDLLEHQSHRQYQWNNNQFTFIDLFKKNLSFALYSVLIIPAFVDSLRGYFHKADFAWFFHPLASFLTFIIYSYYFSLNILGIKSVQSRSTWSQ